MTLGLGKIGVPVMRRARDVWGGIEITCFGAGNVLQLVPGNAADSKQSILAVMVFASEDYTVASDRVI